VLQDIAQRDNAHKFTVFVNDDEAVDAGASDGVVDGGHVVVEGAGEDAGEVLDGC